jgi:hypothetical protein
VQNVKIIPDKNVSRSYNPNPRAIVMAHVKDSLRLTSSPGCRLARHV